MNNQSVDLVAVAKAVLGIGGMSGKTMDAGAERLAKGASREAHGDHEAEAEAEASSAIAQ